MDNKAQTIAKDLTAAMIAAAPAAACGPMQAEPIWQTDGAGLRELAGYRLRDMTQIEVMNAQALQRHHARHAALPLDQRPAFVAHFSPSQCAIARTYRDLVEWREGSPLKCANLTGSNAGGGSGLYIDGYIARGEELARLHARIGADVVMDVRRHMDRGNVRRAITARALVDAVVLSGQPLSQILKAHCWNADVKNLKQMRLALCAILDRMTGPVGAGVRIWRDGDVLAQSIFANKGD